MLKISDITYSVAGRTLVENASVTIPTGHKVGLVGRNGSGKTTLFKIIRKEMVLDTGNVSMPQGWKIGGVSQEVPGNEVSLIDTVLRADTEREELLAEAETATDPGRISEIQTRLTDIDAWSAEARAATILKGLGFTHDEQLQPCSAFSGGWRMRVALAAVLFSEPDLLLLDEPADGLDPRARRQLREILRTVADEGVALVISSHILRELDGFCDSVAIIEKGEIKVRGTVDDVIAKYEVGRRLHEVQVTRGLQQAIELLRKHEGLVEHVGPLHKSETMEDPKTADRGLIRVRIHGSEDRAAFLLRELVLAEIEIISMAKVRSDLEDVYSSLGRDAVS